MEKLIQFQNKVIYQGKNHCMQDEKGVLLSPKSRVHLMKMWRDSGCSIAYLENREKESMFLAQEISYKNKDNTYSHFSICSEGGGNIPSQYVLSTYECTADAPNTLKKGRAFVAGEFHSAAVQYSCKSALYARDFDRKGRCLWLSVIANEEGKGKSGFSAVDLKMKYTGASLIPAQVTVVPADTRFLCHKRPESVGVFAPTIPEVTKEVLKNFNISVPKNILARQKISQNTGR